MYPSQAYSQEAPSLVLEADLSGNVSVLVVIDNQTIVGILQIRDYRAYKLGTFGRGEPQIYGSNPSIGCGCSVDRGSDSQAKCLRPNPPWLPF